MYICVFIIVCLFVVCLLFSVLSFAIQYILSLLTVLTSLFLFLLLSFLPYFLLTFIALLRNDILQLLPCFMVITCVQPCFYISHVSRVHFFLFEVVKTETVTVDFLYSFCPVVQSDMQYTMHPESDESSSCYHIFFI
jgi:hypothetical protein